jgi:hypothetical protein
MAAGNKEALAEQDFPRESGACERGVAQMGWEKRGAHQYYYRKQRDGSTVKSIYVGRGEIARMISQIQSTSPLVERLACTIRSRKLVEQDKAEAAVQEVSDLVRLLTEAALLAAGFHTHKREWRRMRDGGANNGGSSGRGGQV